eukprot:scaffold21.g2067.t1
MCGSGSTRQPACSLVAAKLFVETWEGLYKSFKVSCSETWSGDDADEAVLTRFLKQLGLDSSTYEVICQHLLMWAAEEAQAATAGAAAKGNGGKKAFEVYQQEVFEKPDTAPAATKLSIYEGRPLARLFGVPGLRPRLALHRPSTDLPNGSFVCDMCGTDPLKDNKYGDPSALRSHAYGKDHQAILGGYEMGVADTLAALDAPEDSVPAVLLAELERLKEFEDLTISRRLSLAAGHAGLEPGPSVPWWVGQHDCVRSLFCLCAAQAPGGCCSECAEVGRSAIVYKVAVRTRERLARLSEQQQQPLDPKSWRGVQPLQMGVPELRARLAAASATREEGRWRENRLQQRMANAEGRAAALEEEAHRDGLLADRSFLVDFLTGIARGITGSARGRHYSDNEKARGPRIGELQAATSFHQPELTSTALWLQVFYQTLLNLGGPAIHKFVAENLCGPHLRTTQRDRSRGYGFELGLGALDASMARLKELLTRYGWAGVPMVVGEDGTALQAGLQLEHAPSSAGKFPIYGLCAFTHDNSNATFSTDTVCAVWKRLWRAAAALNLHLMLHAADGDSRVRAAAFQLFLVQSVGERETLRVDHPLVEMCMLK